MPGVENRTSGKCGNLWGHPPFKVCALPEIFVLLAVLSKAMIIFPFSVAMSTDMEALVVEIGTTFGIVSALGLLMLMIPIVLGSAVYLFAGSGCSCS